MPLEKVKDLEQYFPKLPAPDRRPASRTSSDTPRKINKLNDDMRQNHPRGDERQAGKGPGDGEGTSGVPGQG